MTDPRPPARGLLGSLRRLTDTALALARNRVELFALELEEEKCRVMELVLWMSAVVAFGLMALTMVTLTVVILFWDRGRTAALIGLTLFHVAAAIVAYRSLARRLRSATPAFSETVRELKKDEEWLESQN